MPDDQKDARDAAKETEKGREESTRLTIEKSGSAGNEKRDDDKADDDLQSSV
jgi:hypothetical protein